MRPTDNTTAITTRRSFLASTLALYSSQTIKAHDLKPGDPAYRFAEYEAIVNNPNLAVRQLYEYPNINNAIIFSNAVNGLNGFQSPTGYQQTAFRL